MPIRYRWLLGLLACAACTIESSDAVRLRPFTAFRQWHGEQRLTVRGRFDEGSFALKAGTPAELYRLALKYRQLLPDQPAPVSAYDTATGTLLAGFPRSDSTTDTEDGDTVEITHDQFSLVFGGPGGPSPTATLALSPRVDAALELTLGHTRANLDLGGLRISSLDLQAGTSKTTVRFSQPNPIPCRRARVTGGVSEISLLDLGNSRCAEIKFQGAAGQVLLDFGGAWTADAAVRATVAVGALTLRLPRQVGVRLTMDKLLADIEPNGLVRRGDAYVSSNYDRAAHHLDLDLTTTAGSVDVEWIEADSTASSAASDE